MILGILKASSALIILRLDGVRLVSLQLHPAEGASGHTLLSRPHQQVQYWEFSMGFNLNRRSSCFLGRLPSAPKWIWFNCGRTARRSSGLAMLMIMI